jgi:hypothetical protein
MIGLGAIEVALADALPVLYSPAERGRLVKLSTEDLTKAIGKAADGLLFPSETDAPITFVSLGKADPRGAVLKAKDRTPGTKVKTATVNAFFKPVVEEKDWFESEERERAARFRDLLTLLRENLTALRVYKVGDVTIDVYVIGKTVSGELAGVATQIVET